MHSLASYCTSLLSFTFCSTPPVHIASWQSPVTWSTAGPSALGVCSHWPVSTLQWSSVQGLSSGQSVASFWRVHTAGTQLPATHMPCPPSTVQPWPSALVFEGIPLSHASVVHGLPSSGTSWSSAALCATPAAHETTWQSPGSWLGESPSGTAWWTHAPSGPQLSVVHRLLSSQSAALLQAPFGTISWIPRICPQPAMTSAATANLTPGRAGCLLCFMGPCHHDTRSGPAVPVR